MWRVKENALSQWRRLQAPWEEAELALDLDRDLGFCFFAVFVFHIPLFKCLLNSFLKGQTHHVAETTLESEILLPQQGLQESGRDPVLSSLLFILAPELAIHFLPLYSYIISRGLSELMWGTMTTVCHHGVATVRRHIHP